MSTAHEARTRALHVVIATCDVDADGVHDLVAPLADRLADVTLLLPPGAGHEVLGAALALADVVEQVTGRRPCGLESPTGVGPALVDALPAPAESAILAVPSGLRPRRLRRLQRAAARVGAHVAVLPRREAP